jgi:anti-sigma factor RsiW
MTNLSVSRPPDDRALLVHAYVDGELDPANALAVGRQIAADPVLAAELARAQALREVLRDGLPRKALPPHLLPRIEAALGLKSVRLKRPQYRQSWQALAAAAVVALALGSGSTWFVLHQPASDRIAEAIVDDHIRGLIAGPTDVKSSERHIVKPWFNGRIPQAPRVVDLAGEGFPLIGARRRRWHHSRRHVGVWPPSARHQPFGSSGCDCGRRSSRASFHEGLQSRELERQWHQVLCGIGPGAR